jgi:lipoate-protein ligase B
MQRFTDERQTMRRADEIWFVEHPPVLPWG